MIYSDEWKLLTEICKANNRGDTKSLYHLIDTHDFTGKSQASSAALTAIVIDKKEIKANAKVLNGFIQQTMELDLSAIDLFRRSAIELILNEAL